MMSIVRSPVFGPRVAMKAVAVAPRAPKQNIVAIACLDNSCQIDDAYTESRKGSR